jgi:hypothetical protein
MCFTATHIERKNDCLCLLFDETTKTDFLFGAATILQWIVIRPT